MKLIDVLFCDDIRQEVNNKISLMGVYHDIKEDNQVPANISVFMRFDAEKSIEKPVKFSFDFLLNGSPIVGIHGRTNIISAGYFTLALSGRGIPLKKVI